MSKPSTKPKYGVRKFKDSNGNLWFVGVELKAPRGRIDVSALTIWSADVRVPLTKRILRDIPKVLDSLFNDLIVAETKSLKRFEKYKEKLKPHQGRLHNDDELRLVAEIYMTAYNGHIPVQQTVATTLGISCSTAAKRIMAARARGFLSAGINEKNSIRKKENV